MSKSISDVIKLAKDKDAKILDLKFMDFPGLWQHFSTPISQLTEDLFEEGFGFDGSSIRGWQGIHESDMIVIPDPSTDEEGSPLLIANKIVREAVTAENIETKLRSLARIERDF